MKKKYMKKNGFTLLEVIISISIIGIMSVGIYSGYMIMIRQTKDGQVKQEMALEGKKIVEALQGTNFTISDSSFTVGNMVFEKDATVTEFKRFLNDKYKDKDENGQTISEAAAPYIEKITFTPTKAASDTVSLNTNSSVNSGVKKIYISRSDSKDYLLYAILYETLNNNKKEIPLFNNDNKNKMELSIYLTPTTDVSLEYIQILNYKGQNLLDDNTTKPVAENLVINFSNYNENGTLPSGEDIEINMYNKTSNAANVYLEKDATLDVDMEARKGEMNIHNNHAENNTDYNIGSLYNIQVQITKKESNEVLFNTYYKKNIH